MRFFRKAIRHQGEPEVVTIDKSGANTAALSTLNADKPEEDIITVRQNKYLNGEVHHCGRSLRPSRVKPPTTFAASGPCQVWAWDITWLPSVVRGRWYYLYLVEDVFSRKIAGAEVHETENGGLAAALMQRTVLHERCYRHPLVLHADNGAAMKSQTLQAKLVVQNGV